MNEAIKINTAPLVIRALALKPHVYSEIDEIYNKRKAIYAEAAKKDVWYNSIFFRENTIEVELYSLKLTGIFAYAENTTDEERSDLLKRILSITKKAYNQVYRFVINSKEISIEAFAKTRDDDLTSDEFCSELGVVLFLAAALNKPTPITTKPAQDMVLMLKRMLVYYEKNQEVLLNDKQEQIVQNIKKHCKKNIPKSLLEYSSIERRKEFKNGGINSVTTFGFLEEVSCINRFPFTAIEGNLINQEQLDDVIRYYIFNFTPNIESHKDIDLSHFRQMFFISLIILSYSQEYNKAKQIILEKTSEIEELEESRKIRCDLEKAQFEIQSLHQTISGLHSLMNKRQESLNQSQIEIDRLKSKLHKEELEIDRLRSSLDIEMEKNEDLRAMMDNLLATPEKPAPETLEGKNIVVFGGHPSWHKKLNKCFPSLRFINPDKLNFDKSILLDTDYIAICYDYISHAMYSKIMNIARAHDLKIIYVKNNSDKII